MRLTRMYCCFDGYRVAYTRSGSGPVLLLLHGLGGTADFWQPLITSLETQYTVLCPDLLGFGASDKPPVTYTLPLHGRAIEAVVQAANVRGLHAVIGHSCGGIIAIACLAVGSLSTERLVLAAVPYPSPRFPFWQEIPSLDRLMLTWEPAAYVVHGTLPLLWPLVRLLPVPHHLRGAWAGYLEHTCASYLGTAKECLLRANLDLMLPRVQQYPTLLLYGRHDRSVPLMYGQRLKAMVPRSTFVVLADGHAAVLIEGEALLRSWLEAPSDNRPPPA